MAGHPACDLPTPPARTDVLVESAEAHALAGGDLHPLAASTPLETQLWHIGDLGLLGPCHFFLSQRYQGRI